MVVMENRTEKTKEDQLTLFEMPEWWEPHWQGMPEFVQEDHMPFKTLYVHFRSLEDMQEFSELVEQHFNTTTKFIWYPEAKKFKAAEYRYVDES